MKKAIFLFFAIFMLFVNAASATNLRGRLMRTVGGKSTPLAQTRVELLFWNGTGYDNKGYAITDNDGFYFFVNISPGQKFCVLVLGRYYPAAPLVVQGIAMPNYQDLPLIIT